MANATLYVPPEESPHSATLMMWPASRRVHADGVFLRMLQDTIAEIANAIADFEPVYLMADAALHSVICPKLATNVTLWDIPTEDLWARDAGPLFAKRGDALVISHIPFNGWGNKQLHDHDGQVAARVAERLGVDMVPSGVIGEAGGVDHDGHGLMIAHESSWVIGNRNPNLSRDAIEARLLAAYGANRMIWSPGLKGEDITDHHIDSLARFTGPGRVLINLPDNPERRDPFHTAAIETYRTLRDAGLHIEVIPEPTRPRIRSRDFVASYANYYACNGTIIAAQFGDAEPDAIALDALQRHYPDRAIVTLNVDPLGEAGGVVTLNVDPLGEAGGGIHCATQQIPL